VGPEVARRLGRLSAEPDEAFALQPDGLVLWRGEAAARVEGDRPLSPRVRLLGELGPVAARERAARRLEAFLAAEAGRKLRALKKLEGAIAEGRLKGLARGIAYRLAEAGGVLARSEVEADVRALSQAERRALLILGVRFGAFSLFLPALLRAEARDFSAAFAHSAAWRPPINQISPLPAAMPSPKALAARGLRAVYGMAVPVEALEKLDTLMRAAPREHGGAVVGPPIMAALGWSEAETAGVLRGLGFAPVAKPRPGEPLAWRKRKTAEAPPAGAKPLPASPFAALASLKAPPPPAPPIAEPAPARRPRRRPRRRPAAAQRAPKSA
jgi:ATP-dependent RNA helicase SUPV3L1/SUV3